MDRTTCRAWRELDREALRHNYRAIARQLAPGCRLMAVVKADAYGHGAVPVARTLQGKEGARAFAVACLDEALALRRRGIRGEILILGYTPPELAGTLARWRLSQLLLDGDYARALSAQGRGVRAHLAVDTGMHRFGIDAADTAALAAVFALPGLRVRGTMTHLCVADSPALCDVTETHRQRDRFFAAVRALEARGIAPGVLHLQASYGVWNLPPQPCGYARVGVALYGVASDDQPRRQSLGLRPALALRARVAAVRTLAAGEAAGYGHAFRAGRSTRLAVVSIGYADGLPRSLGQQGGELLLRGCRAPVVGRVCMDQLLCDVTDVPSVCPGDVATVIGQDGGACITAEELAGRCGTITNELLSRLSPRLGLLVR